ncbi:alpha/beta fold hydrolase [Nocardioides sp.]|uniref:alpha/beta hydrolase family protein n=1 Tax=Nocardioides sp. TaxID=35761 RepID=UPI001A2DBAB4|nr:alpha/beta fold hydrolase [Nocardioides sp.]MBJ7355724.1 alpha/beta fold hydrolase [Nocardioides sp.]
MTIYDTRNNLVEPRSSTVVADDGRELRATRFEPVVGGEDARGAVVLVPAMATPARFYAAFATWLAESGFHVLTFDYRGTGSVAEMKAERGDVLRWAGDAASALESLLDEDLGLPVTWIGHSLGGQLLPFARHDLLDRALLVAAGSGYWRYNQPSIRWRAPLLFRVVGPLVMRAAGYFPGRRLGLLGDAPSAAMRQWSRWCLSPDYYGVDVPDLGARLAELDLPIAALSFTDDELLSARSHQALEEMYAAAPVEPHRLAPSDLGVDRIGHHGFFRANMRPAWDQTVLPLLATR